MMSDIQKNAENRSVPNKAETFEEFVRWYALPTLGKHQIGIPDQNAFAEKFFVNKDTLTRWKNRREFDPKVRALRQAWGDERTPDVVHAMYRAAMEGKTGSMRLWFKYIEGWNPNKKQKPQKMEPLFHVDDMRAVIEEMPQELQVKYLRMLIDFHADMKAVLEGREEDYSTREKEYPDGL